MKIWGWVGIAAVVVVVGYFALAMHRPCGNGQSIKLAGAFEVGGCMAKSTLPPLDCMDRQDCPRSADSPTPCNATDMLYSKRCIPR